ncbi:peptidoglycan D,D-transpeptidase FtsI family protein [Shouchella shacheensis]|uniref:peptidoglycan D,D-transpeptidase FtsI family protein n=1 Tax=Shouchella shacheensis TaxID=1649580 RepID=UPI00073FB852|nr:penicillin-binding protein 2 [Shouchella shacheensis]
MGKKKPKKQRHVSVRLNILFLIVFLLFSALILRLGVVQIVQGENYEEELNETSTQTARLDAPRGKMLDQYGNTLVDNEMELSITYTNPAEGTSSNEMLEIARELDNLIEMDTENLRERDRKEYWYATHTQEERQALISHLDPEEEGESEYQLIMDHIDEGLLDEIPEEEETVMAIFTQMSKGYAGSPQHIKRAVNEEESHRVSEHLDQLPGIDITRDSRRSFAYGETLRGLFGNVRPIPADQINAYLSQGYERSDLVGTSYLEAQYEDVLRGVKAEVETTSSGEGQTVNNGKEGSRGSDLRLSIDMEYQQLLDEAVEDIVRSNSGRYIRDSQAYAIAMNPKTGDILAMSGFLDAVGEDPTSNEIGAINNTYEMGSAIKGASVLTGFQTGMMSPAETIYDEPLKFPDTDDKASVSNMGTVNYLSALERSSNVYMFYIAMRMMDYTYDRNNPKPFTDLNAIRDAYNEARYYFSQFGLGVDPYVDLPGAPTGVTGGTSDPGQLMDLFIGQYDTYSTLQLAQYISTIANDGVRMKPRLVQEILEPSNNGDDYVVEKVKQPEMLNQIDMSSEHISMVQDGLRQVVTGSRGTARNMDVDVPGGFAAKTGTAETTLVFPTPGDGENEIYEAHNQTLVGYAPFDDPEIAFAIVAPGMNANQPTGSMAIPQLIGEDLLDSYFGLKEERNGPEEVDTILEDVSNLEEATE